MTQTLTISEKPLKKRTIIAIIVALMIALILGHYASIFPYSYKSPELPFRQAEFSKIAQNIQRGTLSPDRQGIVTLPADLASTTSNGKVYVTRSPRGLLLIFFPTWWGKDWVFRYSDYRGYIYCNRPLTGADKASTWASDDSIVLNGPSITTPQQDPGKWQINTTDWFLINKNNPKWYSVMSDNNVI